MEELFFVKEEKLYKPCALFKEALWVESHCAEEKARDRKTIANTPWCNMLLTGGVWEAGGEMPLSPYLFGCDERMGGRHLCRCSLGRPDSPHFSLLALGGAGEERAQGCGCQPQMPAAAQSWDNCSYLFLLFSRTRRVFQERTFLSMMTSKAALPFTFQTPSQPCQSLNQACGG